MSPRRKVWRAIRVEGYEFHFIGGPRPYLRMANPSSNEPDGGYIGAIEGRAKIKKLRDYLTEALRGGTTEKPE